MGKTSRPGSKVWHWAVTMALLTVIILATQCAPPSMYEAASRYRMQCDQINARPGVWRCENVERER